MAWKKRRKRNIATAVRARFFGFRRREEGDSVALVREKEEEEGHLFDVSPATVS